MVNVRLRRRAALPQTEVDLDALQISGDIQRNASGPKGFAYHVDRLGSLELAEGGDDKPVEGIVLRPMGLQTLREDPDDFVTVCRVS